MNEVEQRGNLPPIRAKRRGYEECKLLYLGGNTQQISNQNFEITADMALAIRLAEMFHEMHRVDLLKEKFRGYWYEENRSKIRRQICLQEKAVCLKKKTG